MYSRGEEDVQALLYVLEAAGEKGKKAKHQRGQIATVARAVRPALKTVLKK